LDYDYKTLNENGGKVLLDSGTTFVLFSHELYKVFKISWAKYCRSDSLHCAKTSDFQNCYSHNKEKYQTIEDFFHTFPSFTFQFKGADIDWSPADYFFYNNNLDSYCIGIEPLNDLLLGEIFMRNFDIQFDPEKQRVGFVRSNCDGMPTHKSNSRRLATQKVNPSTFKSTATKIYVDKKGVGIGEVVMVAMSGILVVAVIVFFW
jgi:hypothetical protein